MQALDSLLLSAFSLGWQIHDLANKILSKHKEQLSSDKEDNNLAIIYRSPEGRRVFQQQEKALLEAQISQCHGQLTDLRMQVNIYLNKVFNVQKILDTARSASSSHLSAQDKRVSFSGNSDNDIVEVLALNKYSEGAPEAFAAILTKANGETTTLTQQGFETPVRNAKSVDDVFQYNFNRHTNSDTVSFGHISAPDFIQKIRSTLYFREEDDRYFEVQNAHAKTFGWLLRNHDSADPTHFRTWLQSKGTLFWINGKAGSGKSTLMKYLHRQDMLKELLQIWAGQRQLVMATFFFWHAGQPLQKSLAGVLRALLHQILVARPDLTPVLFPHLSRKLLRDRSETFHFTTRELEQSLILFVEQIPPNLSLFLFIDGVDEYTGDFLMFCKLLVRISSSPAIKVLVSSRPIPECYHVFGDFPSLRLQDLTRDDISHYIEDELMSDKLFIEMDTAEIGLGKQIKEILIEKSSGVFLWIVLVVNRIIRSLVHYEGRDRLLARIDELPVELEDLYDHMFSRMNEDYQREGSLLLQLLSRAQTLRFAVLTALQFEVAISHLEALCARRIPSAPTILNEVSTRALAIRLSSRCCGLIEVQELGPRGRLPEPRIVFLHRTVYDYLQAPSVRSKLSNKCKLTRTEQDQSLLFSSAQLLRHRCSRPHFARPVMDSATDYFRSCVQYAQALSDQKDASYLFHLYTAEQSLWLYCSKQVSRAGSGPKQEYNKIWQWLLQLTGLAELLNYNFINSGSDRYWTLMLVSAALGLPELLQKLIELPEGTRPDLSILCIRILQMARVSSQGWNFRVNCTRAVKALVEAGVNPFLPWKAWQNPDDPFQSSQVSWKPISPWEFWSQPNHWNAENKFTAVLHPEYVDLTVALLSADTQAQITHSDPDAAEDHMVKALKSYKTSQLNPDVQVKIEMALTLIEQRKTRFVKEQKETQQQLQAVTQTSSKQKIPTQHDDDLIRAKKEIKTPSKQVKLNTEASFTDVARIKTPGFRPRQPQKRVASAPSVENIHAVAVMSAPKANLQQALKPGRKVGWKNYLSLG